MRKKKFKLGREVNLLDVYPKSKRPIKGRAKSVTVEDRLVARRFGREYFDGTRNQGYGGYNYHPRFWQPVVKRMAKYYNLDKNSRVLDVGCGKGFMLHDFREIIKGITVAGIEISEYAVQNSLEDVKPFIQVGNAKKLPYADNTFDLVIAINCLHNLPIEDCFVAFQELERVSRKHKFVINDAYRNQKEKEKMLQWNLTGITYFSTKDWKNFFKLSGYTGDFYWFIAE